MTSTSPANPSHKSAKPSARVLIVEDNPVMGQILGTLILRMGLKYKTAPNGEEALRILEKHRFDLILMDIMMPGMSGLETAKKIRQLKGRGANTPIVAVTGNTEKTDIEASLAAGMVGHLRKPVGEFALKAELARHLDLPALEGKEKKGRASAETTEAEGEEKLSALVAETKDDLGVLNWEAFREYGALLKGKLPRLLADFLRAGPDLMSGINDALNDGDGERVAFLAHKLKSTSLVFGAERLSDGAASMEAEARAGDFKAARDLFLDLHFQYERAQAVLRKKLVLLRNMG